MQIQDYSRLWQRLNSRSIPPELLTPEAAAWAQSHAELSYYRAYAYWRLHQKALFKAELERCAQLQRKQNTLPPWKILILHLAASTDLEMQAHFCLAIYQCLNSRLNLSLLDAFLAQFFPEWDSGLLWAGAAYQLARQGAWQKAQTLSREIRPSRYQAERNAWLAQACWLIQDYATAWQWLNSGETQHLATPWLLSWYSLLLHTGYPQWALKILKEAWSIRGDDVQLGFVLAANYERRGLLSEALAIYQALPPEPISLQRQAEVLKCQGETLEAAQLLEAALAQRAKQFPQWDPDPAWAQLHSQYQICLASLAETSCEYMRAVQQDWVQRFTPPAPLPPLVIRSTAQRLRIAYLSADFGLHSSYPMVAALFKHHDRRQFEIFAYHTSPCHDSATAHLQHLSEHWRTVAGLPPRQIAQMIQQDQINILVDLSGHTSLSQLSVVAFQPAPLQISGLCFNAATGLPQFTHRFTDPICTPPQDPPQVPGEKPLYLSSWVFWSPPEQTVPLELPSRRQSLGCVHHPGRIPLQLLKLWAQILKYRPSAVLQFKHRCFASQELRQKYLKFFSEQGISARQLHFEGASPYSAYLAFYNQLDLALDAWPYHGGLSSCDCLWMGVPLLCLQGSMRGHQSLLTQVQHPEWLANNTREYLEIAMALLDSPPDLAARQALRARALQAPFAQPVARVREIEQHYLELWQQRAFQA